MTDTLPPMPPESKPQVEWDGRVSLPARWVENGDFGRIRIPHTDYGKWTKKHCVDGHWYGWNGLYFEWCPSPHRLPVPTVLPDGELDYAELRHWYPGDPLPASYRRGADGVTYVYDKYRDAYIRASDACKGTPGSALRGVVIGLALTATVYLSVIGVPVFLYSVVVMVRRLFEEPPTRENAYTNRSGQRGAPSANAGRQDRDAQPIRVPHD
jgi:hypothetical protein